MASLAERKAALTHRTFLLMFRILLIFGIPAFGAYFLGSWLDTALDARPWGTLASLIAAFALSWTATIVLYIRINREYNAIAREEEDEIARKQCQMRNENKV